MTPRVVEKLCTKKVCVDFLAPTFPGFKTDGTFRTLKIHFWGFGLL